MIWFLSGIFFAFLNAVTMLINQKYKIEGHLISGLRGFGVGVLFIPGLFFVEVPTSPVFWTMVLLESLISTFFNARLYSSSAKYGAGSTSRISVLAIAFGMVFWWIIDYGRFFVLLKTPAVFAGIVVALIIVAVGFVIMNLKALSSPSKSGQIAYLMPAVIALAVMMIVRKEVMEHAEFWSATVYYCTVAIFLSGINNLSIYAYKFGVRNFAAKISSPKILEVGLYMVLASSCTIFFGNMSALYVPNPAYISAITLTSPVWVMIINRIFGVPDKISLWGTIVMFFGLIILIVFANAPLGAV